MSDKSDDQETTDELLARLGIKPAPPDHPVYSKGYTISFPAPSQPPTPSTEERSSESTEPSLTKPIELPKPTPGYRNTRAWVGNLAALMPALQGNPNPQVVKVLLRRAALEGVDWRDLYQSSVEVRRRNWPPAPKLEDVDPTRE
jgi:hypothetical protein